MSLKKIKGLNLGNWLVLEKWISPEVFGGCEEEDEVWLNRTMPPEQLHPIMKQHRDTYISQEDLRLIAEKGFNLVRLPVPFFVFGDRPPFAGCIEYVDKALAWAEAEGLVVMLDLHTVPGSQNGYDNGGLTGVCKWCKDPPEVEFALTVLERLAQRYGTRKGLYGIQVLNEPISWLVYTTAPSTGKAKDKEEAKGSGYVPLPFLKQFYQDAYRRIRAHMPEDKVVVFHDGFRLGAWGNFFNECGMKNVLLDTHIYLFAMDNFIPVSPKWAYQLYLNFQRRLIEKAARYTPVVVGEWCIECRRPFAVASKAPENERDAVLQREYQDVARMQLDAWSASSGWIYWTYQLDRDPDGPMRTNQFGHASMEAWAMRRLWRHGWFPTLT